ncbi:MAG: hypothetical protein WBY44_32010 [Bryobacteraceae bacterium]
MTDEEMALAIGKKLIDNEIKIAVLRGTFDSFRLLDGTRIEWEEMVQKTLLSPTFVHEAQQRYAELQTAISEDKSDEQLIRIVHQVLCDK